MASISLQAFSNEGQMQADFLKLPSMYSFMRMAEGHREDWAACVLAEVAEKCLFGEVNEIALEVAIGIGKGYLAGGDPDDRGKRIIAKSVGFSLTHDWLSIRLY